MQFSTLSSFHRGHNKNFINADAISRAFRQNIFSASPNRNTSLIRPGYPIVSSLLSVVRYSFPYLFPSNRRAVLVFVVAGTRNNAKYFSRRRNVRNIFQLPTFPTGSNFGIYYFNFGPLPSFQCVPQMRRPGSQLRVFFFSGVSTTSKASTVGKISLHSVSV